jgi:hypothetical protein
MSEFEPDEQVFDALSLEVWSDPEPVDGGRCARGFVPARLEGDL